jgi:hypothetical protein
MTWYATTPQQWQPQVSAQSPLSAAQLGRQLILDLVVTQTLPLVDATVPTLLFAICCIILAILNVKPLQIVLLMLVVETWVDPTEICTFCLETLVIHPVVSGILAKAL